jgi:hypothetical protein
MASTIQERTKGLFPDLLGVRFTEATQSTRDKLTLALVTAGTVDQDAVRTAAWRQIERTRAA